MARIPLINTIYDSQHPESLDQTIRDIQGSLVKLRDHMNPTIGANRSSAFIHQPVQVYTQNGVTTTFNVDKFIQIDIPNNFVSETRNVLAKIKIEAVCRLQGERVAGTGPITATVLVSRNNIAAGTSTFIAGYNFDRNPPAGVNEHFLAIAIDPSVDLSGETLRYTIAFNVMVTAGDTWNLAFGDGGYPDGGSHSWTTVSLD